MVRLDVAQRLTRIVLLICYIDARRIRLFSFPFHYQFRWTSLSHTLTRCAKRNWYLWFFQHCNEHCIKTSLWVFSMHCESFSPKSVNQNIALVANLVLAIIQMFLNPVYNIARAFKSDVIKCNSAGWKYLKPAYKNSRNNRGCLTKTDFFVERLQ